MRSAALLVLAFLLPFNGACIIVIGDGSGLSGGSGAGGDGTAFALPNPEEWRVPPVELTPEQQRRKDEADAYIAEHVYEGRPIEKTVQGYSGDILDYIKIPPLNIAAPELPPLWENAALPDGVTLALTEVEQYPELWGPTNTTLFTRPDFSRYIMQDTGASSIEDWIANYEVHGVPDGLDRLYAGLNVPAPNHGASVRINQFKPDVADKSFSLIEMTVQCPAVGEPMEWIGILLTVDRINSSADAKSPDGPHLRLRVEHVQNVNGKLVGTYDFRDDKFRQLPDAWDGWPRQVLGQAITPSVPGGAQMEAWLALVMDLEGSWWAFYNGHPLGFYPAKNLTTLNQGGCAVQYYGEVYDHTPNDGWVSTEMGSGQFATAPAGYVAWVREPKYLDTNWLPMDPQDDSFTRWSKPYETSCYTRSSMVDPGMPWQSFKLGGPGGTDPLCK